MMGSTLRIPAAVLILLNSTAVSKAAFPKERQHGELVFSEHTDLGQRLGGMPLVDGWSAL